MKKRVAVTSITVLWIVFAVTFCYRCAKQSRTQFSIEDINSKELILAFRYRNFAWGFSDYVYLISADGTVKYVDIASKYGKELSLDTTESFSIFDDFAGDADIPVLHKAKKISDSNINKIINIQHVKLKRNGEVADDAGYVGYYCVTGTKDNRKMVCIEESGYKPRRCNNHNVKEIINLIQDIANEANKKRAEL